jgi:hypothetical protein
MNKRILVVRNSVKMASVIEEALDNDDDVAVLARYLKMANALKALNDALRSDQHEAWEKAANRITKLLEE